MATRTITVHDRCTAPECGKVLHSIREGESGLCGACAFKRMPADTKAAMKRLLASAFNGSSDAEKDAAVQSAMNLVNRDKPQGP